MLCSVTKAQKHNDIAGSKQRKTIGILTSYVTGLHIFNSRTLRWKQGLSKYTIYNVINTEHIA